MFTQTVQPKTAQELLDRLTEVERIQIRNASSSELDYLRSAAFASDGPPTTAAMTEVQRALNAKYIEFGARKNWWHSQPWTN